MAVNRRERWYTDALFGILKEEGNIVSFLDVIFEFLSQRTDFYVNIETTDGKLGFAPGEAEKLVVNVFRKYEKVVRLEEKKRLETSVEQRRDDSSCDMTNVASEIEVISDVKKNSKSPEEKIKTDFQLECYNGAVLDNYMWSQTISDVDVRIPVPKDVKSSKMVEVELSHRHLKTSIKASDAWKTVVDGDFTWRTDVESSMWTLVPGEHIHVNLEKCEERWWDAVFVGDPKIDASTINNEKPIEDLGDEEQAKIQEMMYNQMQKQLGKPTTEEMKIHEMMKEAWDKPGSPFAGQPFDPSMYSLSKDQFIPPHT